MGYFDIYKLRLNRYGLNYQQRIQTEREKSFDLYLLKTTNRVEFVYGELAVVGSFEKYKQDETETLHYLLTKIDVNLPTGAVLQIPDRNQVLHPWMVYYLETKQAAGYNKYIMLKMTHYLTWLDKDKISHNSWAFLYGPSKANLKDTLKNAGRNSTIYEEDFNANHFILPKNEYIKKDTYLQIGTAPFEQSYRVTGYDINSTDGVEYVTIDPVYKYDLSAPPTKQEGDSDQDFYWLEGGK